MLVVKKKPSETMHINIYTHHTGPSTLHPLGSQFFLEEELRQRISELGSVWTNVELQS